MQFPVRSTETSAAELAATFLTLSGQAREDFILEQVRNGQVPDFMRQASLVHLQAVNGLKGVIEVAPNYLCLGTDEEYFFAQCSIVTAQKIADVCDAMLPTRKIVDEIWKQAVVKLAPKPWGPPYDASMMSSQRFLAQSQRLLDQRTKVSAPLGALTAGHFKDYILVPGLAQRMDRTCIYGWHQPSGQPIQGEQLSAHERTYVDYSQCARLINRMMTVHDELVEVKDVLSSPLQWRLISIGGPSVVFRVPGV